MDCQYMPIGFGTKCLEMKKYKFKSVKIKGTNQIVTLLREYKTK